MYNTPKTLSTYTSLKRKWQDTEGEDTTEEMDSNAEESAEEDMEDASDTSEVSNELSVVSLLAALKESLTERSLQEQFRKLLQESLLNSLQELRKELTTIKGLVEGSCLQISKLDSVPTVVASPTVQVRNKTPKSLEFS